MLLLLLIYLSFSGWCQNKYKFNIKLDIIQYSISIYHLQVLHSKLWHLYYIIFRHSLFTEVCFLQTSSLSSLLWLSCLRPLRLWRTGKLHSCVWRRDISVALVHVTWSVNGRSVTDGVWAVPLRNNKTKPSKWAAIWPSSRLTDGWCRFLMWSVSGIKIH